MCGGEIEETRENRDRFDCEYRGVRGDVIRIHEAYRTYMEPVPVSPYEPTRATRANLVDLPYQLREVAELVDHWRARAHTKSLSEERENREHKQMLKKAGIPT